VKPVDRARFVERLEQFTRPTAMSKPRLLLIDDDAVFHTMVGDELNRLGYQIIHAEDGASGIEKAREEKPDIIILDLMMPGMSGFEVAEMLKRDESTAGIPILVMTSKDITPDDRMQLQSKISALIPKGQSKSRLIFAIQQVEARRRRAQVS
jgi:CheY-like chemotaxis protein